VIFADDDGMEIDANVIAVPEATEEEEEELERMKMVKEWLMLTPMRMRSLAVALS